jgi:hypothetical protein
MKKYKINETKANTPFTTVTFFLFPSVFSLLPLVQVRNGSPHKTKLIQPFP